MSVPSYKDILQNHMHIYLVEILDETEKSETNKNVLQLKYAVAQMNVEKKQLNINLLFKKYNGQFNKGFTNHNKKLGNGSTELV